MKSGDRVTFATGSILWLYYKDLWPESVGVVDRELLDAKHTVRDRVDVRFPDGTIIRNASKDSFRVA